ncbi:MAG TPA: hypothetical protein VIV11_06415 [Kofleriaceae bacterium]
MTESIRPRTGRVFLASICLVVAVVAANRKQLARVFASSEVNGEEVLRGCGCFGCYHAPPKCYGRDGEEACYRELYRVQIEGWEANRLSDEIEAISPTGVAFVRPTRVRTLVTTR